MYRNILSKQEIEKSLKELKDWKIEGKFLQKHFDFKNFAESLEFINKVGEIAEKADHHPDIKFGWEYADIELTTHDKGGLTQKDFNIAREIDAIDK